MTDVQVAHRMSPELLAQLDKARGDTSRNAFMNHILKQATHSLRAATVNALKAELPDLSIKLQPHGLTRVYVPTRIGVLTYSTITVATAGERPTVEELAAEIIRERPTREESAGEAALYLGDVHFRALPGDLRQLFTYVTWTDGLEVS